MIRFFTLLIVCGVFASCQYLRRNKTDSSAYQTNDSLLVYHKDLDQILHDGKLVAITTYSPTSYFLYKGKTMGYEYDLLKQLAKDLNVELDLKIAHNIDSLFSYLENGDVDMIAHAVTQTISRKQQVAFSIPLYISHQVLVQKIPDDNQDNQQLISKAIELKGETISVRSHSSYMERLLHLQDEIGGKIYINELSGDLTTEEIIRMVSEGDIKYTVSDHNLAELLATFYSNIDVDLALSTSQNISWAFRKNSPQLIATVNKWLSNYQRKADYYIIYNKYYKNKQSFKKRSNSNLLSLNQNNISIYDDIVKEEALCIGWDWRLLSAQIYQESRFDPNVESWVGAIGLMQLMPSTAKEFKANDPYSPTENIKAGTKYLHYLSQRFTEVQDSIQRIKLILAAYNGGYNHIKDAQRLAEKLALNPLVWDNNLENAIVKLSDPRYYRDSTIVKFGYLRGIETITYVNNIFDTYHTYLKFIKK